MAEGAVILGSAEIRRAEEKYTERFGTAFDLMRRAGCLAAEHIAVRAAGRPVLILAGPGNNGGDGFVAARALHGHGVDVTVAAGGETAADPARRARADWGGQVVPLDQAEAAPVLVDALFGVGLSRGLSEEMLGPLHALTDAAELKIALDLPSGVAADSGELLSAVPDLDETLVFGALKPGNLLLPGGARCGRLTLLDIGLENVSGPVRRNAPPAPRTVEAGAHKYQRGAVLVAAGQMPGAAWLSARAAQRAGAGFVTVTGEVEDFAPSSLVLQSLDDVKADKQDAVVVGPGLGRSAKSRKLADAMLAIAAPLVVDGDMFSLFAGEPQLFSGKTAVLTPHKGEFAQMFPDLGGSKVERACQAAAQAQAVVALKGADTVIAAPDGRAVINDRAHERLATAGSGDVLAGIVAAELAGGREPFTAACAAVWRHGDAGCRGRDGMIAEDLLALL